MQGDKRERFIREYMSNSLARTLADLQLDVHYFGYLEGDQNWQFKNVSHPCNSLYFCIDGDSWVCRGEDKKTRVNLKSGHAYLMPANQYFSYGCQSRIRKYWSWFSYCFIPGLDLFDGCDHMVELGPYQENVSNLESASAVRNVASYILAQSIILKVLSTQTELLQDRVSQQLFFSKRYQLIFEYVSDNLSAHLRVVDLAKLMYMTPEALSRAFHRDMGFTLKSYIQTALNNKSCSLLLNTDLKVKSIAYECGYEDPYYFMATFKKLNGMSPTRYRETHPNLVTMNESGQNDNIVT
jgi:AraC-like DNA-binding protein